MVLRHASLDAAVLLFLFLAANSVSAKTDALLDVAQGQLPTDTGSDGKTTFAVEDCKPLGGKALKIVFFDGDSVGDRAAKVHDWTPYSSLEFAALNPAKETLNFTLTLKHQGTTDFKTRCDVPVTLRPGKNEIKINLNKLANNNGSAPELANVDRWYLACEAGKTPTIFLGNVNLAGKAGAAPIAVKKPVATDPERLKRIKAAKMPKIAKPVSFDTPEADKILAALEVYPPDNAWNQVVTDWPVHPNSKNIVTSVGMNKPLRCNTDMGFILVPPDQKRVDVKIVGYAGESDKGPYPVPANVPVEGWPASFRRDANLKTLTLEDVQRDKIGQGGDRHAIVVDPVNRMLYEFYQLKRTDAAWQCAQASIFDLKSNNLRPDGWTSTDAAGLPIFPAIIRYDELKRGSIEHALRVTVVKTRRAYVSPATHFASQKTDVNLPRMGERFRLRKDFDLSGFSPEVKTILAALKKYGMFVADNGLDWAMSSAPDERIPVLHEELRKVKGSDFEVVEAPE